MLPPLFLAGPTAVGKSSLALDLGERLDGEIISVDSMQVYRGLEIGTAKPSPEDRARIPHHLIDVVGLDQKFDAAQFCVLAREAVRQIEASAKVPIFCGGTGFYFKAYLEGLGTVPGANPALRAELSSLPLPQLLQELEERDPVCFQTIDRSNARRVIRALEVIRLTNKPFSSAHPDGVVDGGEKPATKPLCYFLARSSADLTARIDSRVDEMFRRGLVRETEELLRRGLAENHVALQAIGYRQVAEYLRGLRSLSETVNLVKIRTRQFAKRQMTWFRRQLAGQWIQLGSTIDLREIGAQIAEAYVKRTG